MQVIQEPTKSYKNIPSLQQDLALMNVTETRSFTLNQMELTTDGKMKVLGVGEFLLSEIALEDALRRGGISPSCGHTFFQEHKTALDEAIVEAVNAFYRHSKQACSEVKLVTRFNRDKERVILGIPSNKYSLFTHQQAVEHILRHVRCDLELSRANLYPEFLEIAFTDPLNTVKDAVGEVVALGQVFLNSQGTRTRALTTSAFSLRLVCTNGAVANEKMFSSRYAHKGDVLNRRFAIDIQQISERFLAMMQRLPRLGDIAVSEKLLQQIRPVLKESLGTKETDDFLANVATQKSNANDLWNEITHLPHSIENPERKLQLEQLGFKILTMHLLDYK